jgi:ribonuclease BN (tRNA processing enzyme)
VTLAVTVLGSSGMYATAERAASGYLIEAGEAHIWLDAGAGSWRNLLGVIDHRDVDGIFLTHRHPDHTTDVFQAFHARRYGSATPLDPVPLWAPAETLERVTAFIPEVEESFLLRPVSAGDRFATKGVHFSLFRMAHPVDTVGVRIECEGSTIAYSADTGADADFEGLAGRSDVFICEATFQDSDPLWEGHLRASQSGEIARRVGVGELLITHLPPWRDDRMSLEQARAACGEVRCSLAFDGQRVEVKT